MFHSDRSFKDFMIGVLIGGSLGATSAVFLNTKRGKKVQKDLLAKYHKMSHAAQHYLKSQEKKVRSAVVRKLKRKKKR